ncbi:MAG: hypothetical protein SGARI_004381, partial [Bacillariaceae sp.]
MENCRIEFDRLFDDGNFKEASRFRREHEDLQQLKARMPSETDLREEIVELESDLATAKKEMKDFVGSVIHNYLKSKRLQLDREIDDRKRFYPTAES